MTFDVKENMLYKKYPWMDL